MTKKVGNIFIIEPEAPSVCEFCKKTDEVRPYGPNNERICYDCAMKDEETTKIKFDELMDGPGEKPQ